MFQALELSSKLYPRRVTLPLRRIRQNSIGIVSQQKQNKKSYILEHMIHSPPSTCFVTRQERLFDKHVLANGGSDSGGSQILSCSPRRLLEVSTLRCVSVCCEIAQDGGEYLTVTSVICMIWSLCSALLVSGGDDCVSWSHVLVQRCGH